MYLNLGVPVPRLRQVHPVSQPRVCREAPGRCFVLWTIVAILLVLWILGWSMQIAGIHLLLLLTLIVVLLWKLAASKPAPDRGTN